MNGKMFSSIYPEITAPAKYLNTLKQVAYNRNYPQEELDGLLTDFSLKRQSYAGFTSNPESYLMTVVKNAISAYHKVKNRQSAELDEIPVYDETDQGEARDIQEKLNELLKELKRRDLPLNQIRLVELMAEVILNKSHDTYREFMDEVYDLAETNHISRSNVRKLLERLRANVGRDENLRDTLVFMRSDEHFIFGYLEFLLAEFPDITDYLHAYRLSEVEMNSMNDLKKIFEQNGYSFYPNRFPEIYYDDYENVIEIYPELKNNQDGTPDYLGVYIYNFKGGGKKEPCRKSTEGVIVLFRDRIENYRRIPADDLKFAVLMHELGHWMSHWAYKDGYNWSIGYHLPNENTHELFAQLIAYWACRNRANHLDALLALTPKKARNIKINQKVEDEVEDDQIDTEKAYGRYWLMKDRTQSSILNKLHQIREGWMLKDERMIEYLLSEEDDLHKWFSSLNDARPENLSAYEISIHQCAWNISDSFIELLMPGGKNARNIIVSRKFGIGVTQKWHE
jgi:DNA-directed RNA polymerase specialized sigma24 family protein